MIIINTDHCGTLDGSGSIFKAHCFSDDKHLPNKLAQSGKYFMCELSVCSCEALENHQICSCFFDRVASGNEADYLLAVATS